MIHSCCIWHTCDYVADILCHAGRRINQTTGAGVSIPTACAYNECMLAAPLCAAPSSSAAQMPTWTFCATAG